MLFVLLMLLWLGLSGSVQPGDVLTGAVISALLQLFSRRYLPRRTHRPSLRRILVLAEYVLYLVKEIVFSCLGVMRLVWFRREIEPRIVTFPAPLRREGSLVLLANSITLTPGTITVDLADGEMSVHALDAPYAEGLEESGFVRRLRKLEGGDA